MFVCLVGEWNETDPGNRTSEQALSAFSRKYGKGTKEVRERGVALARRNEVIRPIYRNGCIPDLE